MTRENVLFVWLLWNVVSITSGLLAGAAYYRRGMYALGHHPLGILRLGLHNPKR